MKTEDVYGLAYYKKEVELNRISNPITIIVAAMIVIGFALLMCSVSLFDEDYTTTVYQTDAGQQIIVDHEIDAIYYDGVYYTQVVDDKSDELSPMFLAGLIILFGSAVTVAVCTCAVFPEMCKKAGWKAVNDRDADVEV